MNAWSEPQQAPSNNFSGGWEKFQNANWSTPANNYSYGNTQRSNMSSNSPEAALAAFANLELGSLFNSVGDVGNLLSDGTGNEKDDDGQADSKSNEAPMDEEDAFASLEGW